MNINKKKFKLNSKIKHGLYAIFLFILIFALIGAVSSAEADDVSINNDNTLKFTESNDFSQGENDQLSTNSVHDVSSSLTNDEIQSVFDSSKDGDTIRFNEKTYNNVSIVVDKKLNIVSNENSKIYSFDSLSKKAKDMGIENSFAFYFTKMANGSSLRGLTIIGNSDYDVIVEDGSNISIINNAISGGNKAGILLNNSKNIFIENNTIGNSFDGLVLNNVNRSNVHFNNIYSNRGTGLILENVLANNISNNNVYRNGVDGFLLKDAKANRILNNTIIENHISGLRLEGNTTRNIIRFNNISSNVMNIYANSLTNGDEITQNTLLYAKRSHDTYTTEDNTGAAIVFADNYTSVKHGNMNFAHNSIGFNEQWDAKSTMEHPAVDIGANWYFDNDGNYGLGHICPMVFGKALTPDEFKHMSMGFGGDENGLFGQLYDGDNPVGAGAFAVDNLNINGKDYGSVEVDEDGRFNLDIDEESLEPGSVITVTVNGHSFNITTERSINSTKMNTNEPSQNPQQQSQMEKDPNKEFASSSGTGNGTGSGSGLSTGSGSGDGNFTGSGISVGDVSGQSNQGTGDSGENGGGSASQEASAYELLKEKDTPVTAKNSQLLAVFGVALVILIIALGYRSKNKDDYDIENDNFEL